MQQPRRFALVPPRHPQCFEDVLFLHLLDIHTTLLKAIKDKSPETAVVLMTAYASAQTAVSAMKEGAYDYLIKPFEMEELLIMV
ncbi:response regulator, partial [Gemmatimonadota bacterium]